MIHYLLLKFKPGQYTPAMYHLARNTYGQLAKSMDGVEGLDVYQNGIIRSSNADLLIRIVLTSQELLEEYLNHPLHLKFVRQVDDMVEQKTTFDLV